MFMMNADKKEYFVSSAFISSVSAFICGCFDFFLELISKYLNPQINADLSFKMNADKKELL
jgi:hypothetical protein